MEASEQTGGAAPETEAPQTDAAKAAEEQSPVATARDKAIVGNSGLFEQQPVPAQGDPDSPVRTSAPPPQAQSGVPLPEDRAAGVEPGPSGMRPSPTSPAAAEAETEAEPQE